MLYIPPNAPPPGRQFDTASVGTKSLPSDPVEEVAQRLPWDEEAPIPTPPDEIFVIYRLVQEEMKRRDIDLPIMAPAYAHGIWTDTALMQTMLLEPELARRYFAFITRRTLKLVERYLELGIDMIGVGGDFAGNRGPLISPRLYREFIVPEVREVSRFIHRAGGKTINASDGDLWPVIEDFLLGCEVDGYIEIQFRAGMVLVPAVDVSNPPEFPVGKVIDFP